MTSPSSTVACGRRIANSSPPTRNARSDRRTWVSARRPTATSSASPEAWPRSSLTRLRSSTSTTSRHSGVPSRSAWTSWRASSSWKARWLPSSVRPSRSASDRARPYSWSRSACWRSSASTRLTIGAAISASANGSDSVTKARSRTTSRRVPDPSGHRPRTTNMPTSTTNCNTTRATIRRLIANPPSGSADGSIVAGAATLQPPRVSGAICVLGHGPCATPDGSTTDPLPARPETRARGRPTVRAEPPGFEGCC